VVVGGCGWGRYDDWRREALARLKPRVSPQVRRKKAFSAESAEDKQRRGRTAVYVRTPDAGVFGNPFRAPRWIPKLQFCRAFSAKRFFFDFPRARGLTLGFSLASASRLCAGVKPGRAGDDHLTTDHGARGRAPSRVGARPVTPAPSTVVVRPSLQLLT